MKTGAINKNGFFSKPNFNCPKSEKKKIEELTGISELVSHILEYLGDVNLDPKNQITNNGQSIQKQRFSGNLTTIREFWRYKLVNKGFNDAIRKLFPLKIFETSIKNGQIKKNISRVSIDYLIVRITQFILHDKRFNDLLSKQCRQAKKDYVDDVRKYNLGRSSLVFGMLLLAALAGVTGLTGLCFIISFLVIDHCCGGYLSPLANSVTKSHREYIVCFNDVRRLRDECEKLYQEFLEIQSKYNFFRNMDLGFGISSGVLLFLSLVAVALIFLLMRVTVGYKLPVTPSFNEDELVSIANNLLAKNSGLQAPENVDEKLLDAVVRKIIKQPNLIKFTSDITINFKDNFETVLKIVSESVEQFAKESAEKLVDGLEDKSLQNQKPAEQQNGQSNNNEVVINVRVSNEQIHLPNSRLK